MKVASSQFVRSMRIAEIVECLGGRLLHPAAEGREILGVYAGDRISDLIERATTGTLLVTNISNSQLIRVAELMDVPGICITGGAEPAAELAAAETGAAIVLSPEGLFETCGRLYARFCKGGPEC
jgi:hypothetical protein